MNAVLLAPLVAVLLLGLAALALSVQRRSQVRLVGRVVVPPAASDPRPQLLYFTGVACAICHTAQRPAVHTLELAVGETASIQEIDVAEAPDLARRYRVMSLPTTIVLRPGGEVAAVNVGFAPAELLRGQLEQAGLRVAA